MMRVLAVILALLPMQVAALSCMPWHIEDAFKQADESPDRYFVVRGSLTFDARKTPKVDWDRQENVPPETRIPARLEGRMIGKSGLAGKVDTEAELVVYCSGPWCPNPRPGSNYIVFARQTDTGLEIETNPCGGMIFANAEKKMLHRVQSCMSGQSCNPPR